MLNVHPLFTHFPVAFWLGALLMEALAVARGRDDFHRMAVWLLVLGTAGGAAAIITGFSAEESVPPGGPAHSALEAHETLMILSFSLSLLLCIVAIGLGERLRGRKRWGFLLALVFLGLLVSLGADRGAQLVYRYGVGVDWSTAQPQR
jgi:uncharacterized membrane protein